ncbi:MAG: hypothetical protein CMJ78_20775 [Planctomycetaceae bacterium]|nr:hypothetical protein [Planctomycetaceae bacterium]
MPKLPGVNHLKAVRALEKAGFEIARQGKHIVMAKTKGGRRIQAPSLVTVLLQGRRSCRLSSPCRACHLLPRTHPKREVLAI